MSQQPRVWQRGSTSKRANPALSRNQSAFEGEKLPTGRRWVVRNGHLPEQIVEGSKNAVDEGWRFVRWGQPDPLGDFKPGRISTLEPDKSTRVAVDLMGAVREAVGPEIHLCFDVHTQLDPAHVVQMCRDMEEFKPYFIEDPLRSENPGSYRNLRHHVNLPIAAGEQWASKWSFREVIEEDLIDYARIDLCIVGGITEAAKSHTGQRRTTSTSFLTIPLDR